MIGLRGASHDISCICHLLLYFEINFITKKILSHESVLKLQNEETVIHFPSETKQRCGKNLRIMISAL